MVNGWHNSDRASRLPADWPKRRSRILKRDPVCRCPGCPRCTPQGCTAPSTDCDHIRAGDDHRDTNLQGLCNPCHLHKTTRERPAAQRTRPNTTPHPGMTPGG